MGITEEQRRRRRERIGASDVAGIVGLDPFRDALAIYLEKTGQLVDADLDDNAAIHLGNDHEEGLLRFAQRELRHDIVRDVEIRPDDSFMSCNLDGWFRLQSPLTWDGQEFEPGCYGVEAKTTSYIADWGEGRDAVPPRVTLQCQAQCHVGNLRGVFVAVLMPEFGRLTQKLYYVPRDDELIDTMLPQLRVFWFEHVQAKEPPAATERALQAIARVHRKEGKHVALPVKKYDEWQVAKQRLREAEKLERELKAQVLGYLRDAEIGDLDGQRELTFFGHDRRTYGQGEEYEDPCPTCGVGTKTTLVRTARERKVKLIGGPNG